ncbi:MAG: hypothetical protein ACRECP_07795 [Methylocella sp.]
MLNSSDAGILRAKPNLVKHLLEPKLVKHVLGPNKEYPHCFRLIHYRTIAKNVLEMCKENDASAAKGPGFISGQGLAENYKYRELEIARCIQITDPDLFGMLKAEKMLKSETMEMDDDKPEPMCMLYARLMIGHENDPNCSAILDEWRQGELPIPPGEICITCG